MRKPARPGGGLHILHLALGGCLRAPPVRYGATTDTGGHIAYVLSAAEAQLADQDVARITLVTRRFDEPSLGEVHSRPAEYISPKLEIIRIPTDNHRYLEKEALSAELPAFTLRFLEWLEEAVELPSVIHAHFADAAKVALAAREQLGIPFIYTPHALGMDKARRCDSHVADARIIAERRAIGSADAIIVSTRDEAERQVAAYEVEDVRRRLHVVAPGIPDHSASVSTMSPLAFANMHRPMVLAISRPTRRKNLIAVAQAFAGSRLRDQANLVILAGQHDATALGAEERGVLCGLREIIETPSLASCAALPPRHTSADVQTLYRHAAHSGGVFVSPALHEPFGLTLLEAGAAGLPVVTTIHGGAADIVRLVGHGSTVDPQDHHAIAEACLRIISDSRLRERLSAAGLQCANTFSWHRYARRSIEIYAAVARAEGARASVAA